MRWNRCILIVWISVECACAAPALSATAAQIESAVAAAKAFLYSQQQESGWWVALPDNDSATWRNNNTIVATYALLAAREDPRDPRIQRAIDRLKGAELDNIYALALRCQIWSLLPRDQQRALERVIARDFQALMSAVNTKEPNIGLYHYRWPASGQWDNSCSQFGVLGTWASVQMGFEVPPGYWRMVDAAWRQTQGADGGWAYNSRQPDSSKTSAHMTAAGVATLFITQEFLRANAGLDGRNAPPDPNLEAGLRWISQRLDPGFKGYTIYGMYGLERIGLASGRKYFGTIDWYSLGADLLVKGQSSDGAWNDYGTVAGTSLALVFLHRGRAPVVLNKLEYGIGPETIGSNWNLRPRDAANLVRWVSRQLERDFNWQIVNLAVSPDDLHDAPILYISGNQRLTFSDDERLKLKHFIEAGGLILGNADAGNNAFADSFRALGTQLFGYGFRELPPEHCIYTNQQFDARKWRNKPGVVGMSNGSRELMLLIPRADAARAWQAQMLIKEEMFQLGANIFLYSVDKQNLQRRGESHIVKPPPDAKLQRTIKLARLTYDGNWDPEPGSWRRLAAVLRNESADELIVEPVVLGVAALDEYRVAHLTGTQAIKLDDKQRADVRAFVDGGGTLIIDSCGGSSAFGLAIESELRAIFGPDADQLRRPLPIDADVYNAEGSSAPLTVVYRSFARRQVGELNVVRLRGIRLGTRVRVFFSPEDLSTGLVGQPVDGIVGYEPGSATALMRAILLYAAQDQGRGGASGDGGSMK